MQPYDTFTFTQNGADYIAELHFDPDMGAPWEEHEGHGQVSEWTARAKRPGEIIIARDRGRFRYYDFAATRRIALRDGWNAAPYDVPGETPRQRAAKAARADMERMRAWCADEWHWCGVIVRPAGACRCCGPSESVWGIESDAGDYLREVACEIAEELAYAARAAA